MKKILFYTLLLMLTITVNAQDFAIAPTKLNLLYCGIDNPVKVVVENHSCTAINVITNNGTVKEGHGCEFYINPERAGVANIKIQIITDGETKLIGSSDFRVDYVPDPKAMIAGKNGGDINRNLLIAQNYIAAESMDFDFEVIFKVKSFSVVINRGEEKDYSQDFQGNTLNPELKNAIRNANIASTVRFENIVAVGPDGKDRIIGPLEFVLR